MNFNPDIANQFLQHLTSVQGAYMAIFLKEKFNILDEELAKMYELKLEKEGYITTRQVSSALKVCQLTEAGQLFMFDGGYFAEPFSEVIPEDDFIYFVLRELNSKANTLSTINENIGGGYSKSELDKIEKYLYRQGWVDLRKLPMFGNS
ncbi:MAG TPA: hypothetical protein PLC65_12280, partial [Bacteroidia bacterium]|nr:hypothetical protein [Bacteroidia bacterium]